MLVRLVLFFEYYKTSKIWKCLKKAFSYEKPSWVGFQGILQKIVIYFQISAALILLIFGTKETLFIEGNMKKLAIPAIAWCLVRLFGAFSNSIDDVKILEENGSDVATGLAANVWFSFYKYAVQSDIKKKMQEFTKDTKELMIGRSDICSCSTQIDRIRAFEKLIVLLPNNCHRDKKLDLGRDEKIYQHIPGLCDLHCFADGNTRKCLEKQWIEFTLPKHVRKDPAKLDVYWIFENFEDEEEYAKASCEERKRNDKAKILITYDFPQLLQSVMGPGKGWEPTEKPLARRRNIEKFKKIIQETFIQTDYSWFR